MACVTTLPSDPSHATQSTALLSSHRLSAHAPDAPAAVGTAAPGRHRCTWRAAHVAAGAGAAGCDPGVFSGSCGGRCSPSGAGLAPPGAWVRTAEAARRRRTRVMAAPARDCFCCGTRSALTSPTIRGYTGPALSTSLRIYIYIYIYIYISKHARLTAPSQDLVQSAPPPTRPLPPHPPVRRWGTRTRRTTPT
jgi:hypothetical protein